MRCCPEIAGGPPRPGRPARRSIRIAKKGLKGGEAYRDPFDPINWPMASISSLEKKLSGTQGRAAAYHSARMLLLRRRARAAEPRPLDAKPDATGTSGQEMSGSNSTPAKSDKQEAPKPAGLFADDGDKSNPAAGRPQPAQAAKTAAPADKSSRRSPTRPSPRLARKRPVTACDAAKLQAAISALATAGPARPVAEVRETPKGSPINLTDDVNYGMFANGSAEPTPGLGSCARQDHADDRSRTAARSSCAVTPIAGLSHVGI